MNGPRFMPLVKAPYAVSLLIALSVATYADTPATSPTPSVRTEYDKIGDSTTVIIQPAMRLNSTASMTLAFFNIRSGREQRAGVQSASLPSTGAKIQVVFSCLSKASRFDRNEQVQWLADGKRGAINLQRNPENHGQPVEDDEGVKELLEGWLTVQQFNELARSRSIAGRISGHDDTSYELSADQVDLLRQFAAVIRKPAPRK
jgi:hypothetical protein